MRDYHYNIENMKEKGDSKFFDVTSKFFRLSVRAESKIRTNIYEHVIYPLKLTLLGEEIKSLEMGGPHNLKPVAKTETFVIPVAMIGDFFEMLQNEWIGPNNHTMSEKVIEEFYDKLCKTVKN